MGPSGAGKTTLLNCLAGKLDYKSGTLLINGRREAIRNYRRLIGYVPQVGYAHLIVGTHAETG